MKSTTTYLTVTVCGVAFGAIAARAHPNPAPLPLAFSDCHCEAASGEGDYDCPDEAPGSGATIVPKNDGTCMEPLDFCFGETPCKWEYTITYNVISSTDIITYFNGVARSTATNAMGVSHGPLTVTLGCGQNSSIALGSNGNVCIEVLLECEVCPASQD